MERISGEKKAETCRFATPWLEAAWWFHSGLCLQEPVQHPFQNPSLAIPPGRPLQKLMEEPLGTGGPHAEELGEETLSPLCRP